ISNEGMNLFEPNVETKKAAFAAGCFWGVDSLFGCAKGVIRTRCCYTGGIKSNPTYHDLGDHTEAVDIEYDPQQTTYDELLTLFWANHDSTVYVKRQYMSAIYYYDEEQRRAAEASRELQQQRYAKPIKTEIVAASNIYDAEDYHQKYFLQNVTSLFESLQIPKDAKSLIGSHVCARLNGYIGGYGNYEQFSKEAPTWGLSADQLATATQLAKSPPFQKCH
ncbi:Peptide methionine sulfoxide reductase, partial [Fragariocoptes setiger]